jgi:hypothetical protein
MPFVGEQSAHVMQFACGGSLTCVIAGGRGEREKSERDSPLTGEGENSTPVSSWCMPGVAIVQLSRYFELEISLFRLKHQDKGGTNGRDPQVGPRRG